MLRLTYCRQQRRASMPAPVVHHRPVAPSQRAISEHPQVLRLPAAAWHERQNGKAHIFGSVCQVTTMLQHAGTDTWLWDCIRALTPINPLDDVCSMQRQRTYPCHAGKQ